jgi:Glycosyl transferase family 2
MTSEPPKVSIGLAVFNGERYIQEALDSILTQTFTDFEVIIADNASTDRTGEICQDYAAKDSRFHYHRNPTNIGGINNENLTVHLAQGQYFRLAAYDDILAPDLLQECVQVLDSHPEIVLCYSRTVVIDAQGDRGATIDQSLATSPDAKQRFYQIASSEHTCEASYALIRAEALRKTELQPNYPESDFGLLCELGLQGQFHQLSTPLFYRRTHDSQVSGSWHLLQPAPLTTFMLLKQLWSVVAVLGQQASHYWRIILRSPLPWNEKVTCYVHALRFMGLRLLITRRNLRERFFLTKESFSALRERFSKALKALGKGEAFGQKF